MKITVLGAGAVGSMFGGLIRYRFPGVRVVLIGRGSHCDAVRRQGHVCLKGPWRVRKADVAVSDDPGEIASSDYVLLTVKSQSSEEAVRRAAPYLRRATVISIQNGINQRVVGRFVPPQRLIVAVTATNMAVSQPGTVSLQWNGPTFLGDPVDGADSTRLAEATGLLRRTGLAVAATSNILGVQYNKLMVNAIGCASALSASNFFTDCLFHRPWRRIVGMPLLRESLDILRRAGIDVTRSRGVSDTYRLQRLLKVLDFPLLDTAIRTATRRRFNRRPIVFSLQQDLLRGKRTEIDFINGELVRLAEEHGCGASRNAKVVELVHRLEERGKGNFLSRDEVISAFSTLSRQH